MLRLKSRYKVTFNIHDAAINLLQTQQSLQKSLFSIDLAAVPDLQLGAGAVKTAVQLTATIAPANASNKNAVWQSSNPAVASVNASTGYVTAVGAGTATITVTTADGGLTAGCDVTVTLVP